MTKKVYGIIIRVLIILLFFQVVAIQKVEAKTNIGDILSTGENFVEKGKTENEKNGKANEVMNTTNMKSISNDIYNVLLSIGVVLSVIIGGVLGIQLMWGSVEQQVKAKEMLIPYALGCVVVFGAFGTWKLAVTVFSQL